MQAGAENAPKATMNAELVEEIEVLRTIYGDAIEATEPAGTEKFVSLVTFKSGNGDFAAYFHIPPAYPATSPEVALSVSRRDGKRKAFAEDMVASLLSNSMGNVVMFSVIEALKELFADDQLAEEPSADTEPAASDELEQDRGRNTDASTAPRHPSLEVHHGPTTTEQKSVFQSHFAVVRSMEEVNLFKSIVYEDKKVARATHNIFAYRFTGSDGIVHHDCDDDGENAAGSRLAEMIRLMKVDNVAVIVSRWFGGILLGPDRFKFICNSARYLLEEHRYGGSDAGKKSAHGADSGHSAKKSGRRN